MIESLSPEELAAIEAWAERMLTRYGLGYKDASVVCRYTNELPTHSIRSTVLALIAQAGEANQLRAEAKPAYWHAQAMNANSELRAAEQTITQLRAELDLARVETRKAADVATGYVAEVAEQTATITQLRTALADLDRDLLRLKVEAEGVTIHDPPSHLPNLVAHRVEELRQRCAALHVEDNTPRSPLDCGAFADGLHCDMQRPHGGNMHSGLKDGKRVWWDHAGNQVDFRKPVEDNTQPARPTQKVMLDWVRSRWPNRCDIGSRAMKLGEEAGEVLGAAVKMSEGRKTLADLRMETAQVALCAMALAESAGFDLDQAVADEYDRVTKPARVQEAPTQPAPDAFKRIGTVSDFGGGHVTVFVDRDLDNYPGNGATVFIRVERETNG